MASSTKRAKHAWKFYRAGGVDQAVLEDGADLQSLDQLDQKLWVALACPTRGLEMETRTLDLIDTDKDGRIRPPEILAAVAWCGEVFKDLDDLFKAEAAVPLSAIHEGTKTGKELAAGARRLLQNLGKSKADAVSLEDVADTAKIFAATKLNGDGVIPPDSADDEATTKAIEDIIAAVGSEADRSGKQGVTKAKVEKFFEQAAAHVAWLDKAESEAGVRVLGDGTAAAAGAVSDVRAKVDDYFTRTRLASYDARAGAALNAAEAELVSLAPRLLSREGEDVAKLPIARIEAARPLPLTEGLNPAWAEKVRVLLTAAVEPILGAGKREMSEADWTKLKGQLAPYDAWVAAKPASDAAKIADARLRELVGSDAKAKILALIEGDAALEPESSQIGQIEKMILFRRDLVKLLKNFVNFSEFYGKRQGIFQTGTLYLDGRSCDLCLPVEDAGKHASLAGLAKAYLAYCDCTRKSGEKRSIVAAFTGGGTDNLMVGRNGVFYDRKGQDWDATITKIVENPISIRQAFWSPYKTFIRFVEEQVAKRAAAAEAESGKGVQSAASEAANADKAKPADPAAAAAAPPEKKIDVGTVAAIGVAIGGIATFFSSIIATFLGLGMWMPLGIVALVLAISGPAMLVAWLKLRQRNVGPILDANGWAVNAFARINVPFGGALTGVAHLPEGAERSLEDPFAEKPRPWKFYVFLLVVLGLAVLWFLGKLDPYLPMKAKAATVLQRETPAQVAPAAAPSAAPAKP